MKLKKELGLLEIFCIASGAMISSGIFVLPGIAYQKTGPSVFIAYILSGILASMGMLSQAELVSAMPKAGGDYFYVSRSFGPAVGTINGLLTWFSLSLKSSFALIGMGAFVSLIAPFNVSLIALVLSVFFILINLIGVKETATFQIVLVLTLLMIMFIYAVIGLPKVKIGYFEPFTPSGISGILTTTGFVFISYGGLLKVSALAEEVKNPGKTIPIGMILSLLIVSFAYFIVIIVTVGVLPGDILSGSLTPISDGAKEIIGKPGFIVMSIAAILAFASTANAGIMAASRYPLALSRDLLLPKVINKTSKRFNTPYISILITGIFIVSVLFLKLEVLVKAASTVVIFSYIFASLSVIILRESRLQNYKPVFRTPLYPWLQIIGILGCSALLVEMGLESIIISSILVLIALGIYFIYGKRRRLSKKESAILYIVRRITAKEILTRTLESELREIIRERDDIVKDRFDSIVEKAIILDIEKRIQKEELFSLISKRLSNKLNIGKENLFNLMKSREERNSTVLTPFIAIPHIVIDGNSLFDIALIRCKKGCYFTKNAPDVRAVFVLIGSADERNFHLKALSAIAQIVHEPEFEKKWLNAFDAESLRDIVLLGERKRYL